MIYFLVLQILIMADFTTLLIAKVRSNEMLYDMEHPQYKNAKLKETIYDEIGKQLNTTGISIILTNFIDTFL